MELSKQNVNNNLPFLLAFFILAVFHCIVDVTTDDYSVFKSFATETFNDDMLSFLEYRYYTWTSRLLIEPLTLIFVQLPTWFFCVVNTFVLSAILVMTYKLFSKKRDWRYALAAVLLASTYKLTDQKTAGYLVTFIVYMWPLMFFLITLFPFKNNYQNGSVQHRWYKYPLLGACAFFCCNCEQVCVTAFLSYALFIAYTYKETKKIDKLYCTLLLIAIAHMVFFMTCPGNATRTASEIATIRPEYATLGMDKKLLLCVASPMMKYFYNRFSFLSIVFGIILPYFVYRKQGGKFDKNTKIALLPLLITVVSSALYPVTKQIMSWTSFRNGDMDTLIVLSIVSIIFFGAIIYSLYFICKDDDGLVGKYGIICVFIIGIASRACLGLTPSYTEPARTFFILEYAMLASCIWIASRHLNFEKNDSK